MSMRKAFLALLLAASVTPAMAQEKNFELKLSHWCRRPIRCKRRWKTGAPRSRGKWRHVKSKVFPASAVGKAFDHYDMARDGIADVTYINPGYQPAVSRSSAPASCRS